MKILLYIAFIFTIMGCRPSPDYNPFNEQYDVLVSEIVQNGCDTISAGCGYYNLQVAEGRFRPFYQIFIDDSDKVLAKGFTYYEDTVQVDGIEAHYDEALMESLLSKPIDLTRFNAELAKYGYQVLSKSGRQIRIGSAEGGSIIDLDIEFNTIEEDSLVIRQIQYWKQRN
jgi:hypothetical protein